MDDQDGEGWDRLTDGIYGRNACEPLNFRPRVEQTIPVRVFCDLASGWFRLAQVAQVRRRCRKLAAFLVSLSVPSPEILAWLQVIVEGLDGLLLVCLPGWAVLLAPIT